MKSLKGYRIGTIVDYDQSDYMSENYAICSDRRKWREIKENQVILKLPIYQHAPRLVHQYVILCKFHISSQLFFT